MSQISILGFTPSSYPESSSRSIHWAILLSPLADSQNQTLSKAKGTSRFFHHQHSKPKPGKPVFESTLFDIQNHQLRQQAFPTPLPTHGPQDSGSDSGSTSTDELATRPRTSTTIVSSPENRLLYLRLRIRVSTHPKQPQKLLTHLSTALYATPTYGPEDDWLHAALEELVWSRTLESSSTTHAFHADAILQFAQEVARPILSESNLTPTDTLNSSVDQTVHEFDYAAQLTRNAEVKAMFGHSPSSSIKSSTSSAFGPRNSGAQRPLSGKNTANDGSYRFLGFRISPSPNSLHYPSQGQNQWGGRRPYSFERQDDPYAGLM